MLELGLFNVGIGLAKFSIQVTWPNHIINSFFFREFQPMTSALDDSSLSSDQDTNQFLVQAEIEPQISYTIIRDFTNWANWNPIPYY